MVAEVFKKNFQLGSAHDLFSSAPKFYFMQLENQKIGLFCQSVFFLISPAFSTLFLVFFVVNNNIFSCYKMNDFWVEKFLTARKKSFKLKKLCIKKIQLGFSSKIKVPSSAQLSSETFQQGSAKLGKSQLELITTVYVQRLSSYCLIYVLCLNGS